MEDALNTHWEEDKNDPRFKFGKNWAKRGEEDLTSEAGLRFVRLLLNSALYTVSIRPDMIAFEPPSPPSNDTVSHKERQRQLQSLNLGLV